MNFTEKDEAYKAFMSRLDKQYGTDLFGRLKKMSEEYGELVEAVGVRALAKDDLYEYNQHVIEEAGDVALILSHLLHIYGSDLDTAIQRAKDKFDFRMKDKEELELTEEERVDMWFGSSELTILEKIFNV